MTSRLVACLLLLPLLGPTTVLPKVKEEGDSKGNVIQKPVRPDKVATGRLPAPRGLSKRGIRSYDYKITLPLKVVMNFYDQTGAPAATVELSENTNGKSHLYKILPVDGAEEWVQVERQDADSALVYAVTSSTGGELGVRLERGAGKKKDGQCLNGAVPVKAVSVTHENG